MQLTSPCHVESLRAVWKHFSYFIFQFVVVGVAGHQESPDLIVTGSSLQTHFSRHRGGFWFRNTFHWVMFITWYSPLCICKVGSSHLLQIFHCDGWFGCRGFYTQRWAILLQNVALRCKTSVNVENVSAIFLQNVALRLKTSVNVENVSVRIAPGKLPVKYLALQHRHEKPKGGICLLYK